MVSRFYRVLITKSLLHIASWIFQATDRLKTPEEEARGEKARLEKLEADRKRRMLGITEDSEKKKSKHRSADELNDLWALKLDIWWNNISRVTV